jgi:hypothetical protein
MTGNNILARGSLSSRSNIITAHRPTAANSK